VNGNKLNASQDSIPAQRLLNLLREALEGGLGRERGASVKDQKELRVAQEPSFRSLPHPGGFVACQASGQYHRAQIARVIPGAKLGRFFANGGSQSRHLARAKMFRPFIFNKLTALFRILAPCCVPGL
jgi:hypothetical protein